MKQKLMGLKGKTDKSIIIGHPNTTLTFSNKMNKISVRHRILSKLSSQFELINIYALCPKTAHIFKGTQTIH
jgi:hypothetical protein